MHSLTILVHALLKRSGGVGEGGGGGKGGGGGGLVKLSSGQVMS